MSEEPIRLPATAVPVEPTATSAAAAPAMASVLRLMKRMVSFVLLFVVLLTIGARCCARSG